MIGVIADPLERSVVTEFFELFKTPWESYRSGRHYDVLLCSGEGSFDQRSAKLVIVYAGRRLTFDRTEKADGDSPKGNRTLLYKGTRIPTYGESITFREEQSGILVDEETQQSTILYSSFQHQARVRIGYDLFSEVNTLLTVGQPAVHAGRPTLDLHITLLRDLIVGSGVTLIEIPPVPEGFRFIACLTHDVDHPSIRRHRWDHTMVGFLYRALLCSLGGLFCRRTPLRNLLRNWAAALKLPFVHMGYANDFWAGFVDQYLELEKGLCSTFFVIPFEGRPGRCSDGVAPPFRATRYGAKDIAEAIGKILAAGSEVALHGIDAWLDSSSGRAELEELRRLTGSPEIGVRMHWLYYDQQSPLILEQAGVAYDSTVGYTNTIGYRAGTTQVFMPLQATRLLELPMHVMDTALFYPNCLGLSAREVSPLLGRLLDDVTEFGGCMTINWHDRSLSPERLWGEAYRDVVQDLKSRGAWFATAGQAVSWFRKRRSAAFQMDGIEFDVGHRACDDRGHNLPGLEVRIHNPGQSGEVGFQERDRVARCGGPKSDREQFARCSK